MGEQVRPGSGRGTALRSLVGASAALFLLVAGGNASAESPGAGFSWAETYAGLFAGTGLTGNRLVDVDGFANWGNPGSVVEYDDEDFAAGLLAGKRFHFNGMPFRLELDATFSDLSASTNRLDPTCPDESAAAKYRWVATARAGVEETLGRVTVFATGGLAAAEIDNSVTDIDYDGEGCLEPPVYRDPDDSFHDSSTELGWVIGAGVETAFADAWTLRLEGSYLDFGRNTFYVNRSGGGRCGAGGPRRPCPYQVENTLGIVRLAVVHRFGP